MGEGGDGEAPAPAPGRTNMVLWDMEKCPIPNNYEASKIFPKIKSKLSAWGFRGPVKMRAVHVNNYVPISPQTSKELSDSGISVDHIKYGGKDYPSYPIVLDHMLDWIQESPVAANVLFISVNRHFFAAYALLREHKYNILRIRPEFMDSKRDDNDYCSWSWSDILLGGRPLIASLCYNNEWTWSETCHDGLTMFAPRSGSNGGTKLRALRPRRNMRTLSNGALYLRRDLKLLHNGGEPAGLGGNGGTRCLCPRRNIESLSNGGEPSGSGGNDS